MFDKRIVEIIEKELDKICPCTEDNYGKAQKIARALWDSGLVSNSSKALDEQELNIYKWTAMETDGYTHMESGVALNMLDAFIKATEHSPSYHKYIEIERIDKENYTDAHKELLDWYKEVK